MKTLQEKIDAIIERQHSLSDVKLLIAIDSNEINKAIQELRGEIITLPSINEGKNTMKFISLSDVLALIGEKK